MEIDAGETVGRFVYDSDKVKSDRVLLGAFLPMFERELSRFETSVLCLSTCTNERAWHLGRTTRTDKTLKARADVAVSAVLESGLRCVAAPVENFPEHAVLIGWPEDKPSQKAIAMQLAASAALRLPP